MNQRSEAAFSETPLFPAFFEMFAWNAFNFSVLNKVLLMKLLWYSDVMSYKEKNVSITGLVYEHKDMGALPLGHSALMELSGIDVRENYSNDFDYPTYTVYPKECDFSLLSEKEKNIILKVCKKFRNDVRDF